MDAFIVFFLFFLLFFIVFLLLPPLYKESETGDAAVSETDGGTVSETDGGTVSEESDNADENCNALLGLISCFLVPILVPNFLALIVLIILRLILLPTMRSGYYFFMLFVAIVMYLRSL